MPTKLRRIALVDIVRGIAIIGVVFYHFCWDLRYFEFILVDVANETGWYIFARALLAIFLFLTGVSLVLGHGDGMRWPQFWRRFAIVGGAALLVTLGTYIIFPYAFVYFGVLHAIALFSLMAVPFLRLPVWVPLVLGVVWIALPAFFTSEFFNVWYWSWIGFWTVPPLTEDLVPIFPGFGFTLLGLGLIRLAKSNRLMDRLAKVKAEGRALRYLALAGRWSLVIYLVHQPIILGLMTPVANYVQRETPEQRAEEFAGACFSSCFETRGNANQCRTYCTCALEQVEMDDMWEAVTATEPTYAQSQSIEAVTNLCNAMAETSIGSDPDRN